MMKPNGNLWIGDRVRVINKDHPCFGKTATITFVSSRIDRQTEIRVDGEDRTWNVFLFELEDAS